MIIDVNAQLIPRMRPHNVMCRQLARHLHREIGVQPPALVDVCQLAQLHCLAFRSFLQQNSLLSCNIIYDLDAGCSNTEADATVNTSAGDAEESAAYMLYETQHPFTIHEL